MLITTVEAGDISFIDIADKTNNIGFIIGSPASQAFRETLTNLNDTAPEGVRYQPRQQRYETLEEGLMTLHQAPLMGLSLHRKS